MTWATRFRIRQRVRGSLWLVPLLGIVLGVGLGFLDVRVEESVHLPAGWTYSASTATTVLSAIVGSMAALTGFVVTVTVLVAQMALGTFSARFMRIWYRDPMLKAVLALLLGSLAFSFSLLHRVESDFVPNLGVWMAGVLVLVSLLLFMVFLDGYLHRLRPVAVMAIARGYVQREFERLVSVIEDAPDVIPGPYSPPGEPALVVRSAHAGALQAIHVEGLVEWARERDCLLALRHQVGDYVPADATLIEVYGGRSDGARDEAALRGMVALGYERTIDQDPAFAIRIIVDVAAKALSAAINDPTTAVQALDQLGEVLRIVGTTDLGRGGSPSGDPPVRGLVIPMRSWEDYLALGVTEIRLYGASTIQVVRRMRAMLEELRDQVAPANRPAVDDELARLDATVASAFGGSADLDRARVADPEGIGGVWDASPRQRPVGVPAKK